MLCCILTMSVRGLIYMYFHVLIYENLIDRTLYGRNIPYEHWEGCNLFFGVDIPLKEDGTLNTSNVNHPETF